MNSIPKSPPKSPKKTPALYTESSVYSLKDSPPLNTNRMASMEEMYYQQVLKLMKENESLKQQLDSDENTKLKTELQNLRERKEKYKFTLKESEKKCLESNNTIKEMKENIETLERERDKETENKAEEINNLNTKIASLEKQSKDIKEQLNAKVALLEKENKEIKEKVKEKENLILQQEKKIKDLSNSVNLLQNATEKLAEKEQQIASLSEKLNDSQSKFQNISMELKTFQERQMKEKFKKLANSNEKMNFADFNTLQSQAASYLDNIPLESQKSSEIQLAKIRNEFLTKKINFSEISNEFSIFLLNNYFRYLDVSMVLMEKITPEIESMLTHMLSVSDLQKKVINLELDPEEYKKTFVCDDPNCSECNEKFQKNFKLEMSQLLDVKTDAITINNFNAQNEKVVVGFFLNNQNGLTDDQRKKIEENKANKNLQGILKSFREINVSQLFQKFQITYNMLDAKGNMDYTKWTKEKEFRGNMDYFFPIGTRRVGLNVSKKYDNKDDLWLGMDNKKGEWAVAFHGTAKDDAVKNIVKDQKYKPGIRQMYENSLDVKTNQKCGKGIYCALKYSIVKTDYSKDGFAVNTSNGNERYRIAFQNRINPETVKIPVDEQNYYIINDPRDIRPYGVLIEKL